MRILAGGTYSQLVVGTLMGTLLPQLTDAKIPHAARDLLLQALHHRAEEGEGVKEAMRPLAPTLAAWLHEAEPSEAVLGCVSNSAKSTVPVSPLVGTRLRRAPPISCLCTVGGVSQSLPALPSALAPSRSLAV